MSSLLMGPIISSKRRKTSLEKLLDLLIFWLRRMAAAKRRKNTRRIMRTMLLFKALPIEYDGHCFMMASCNTFCTKKQNNETIELWCPAEQPKVDVH
mmetsp:Transcript_56836/g.130760  ORF Transcript_56836/g.130760 Transcript_56836/m.130760 type:complete len:97 (+) Transcript_56836:835-1125(+)